MISLEIKITEVAPGDLRFECKTAGIGTELEASAANGIRLLLRQYTINLGQRFDVPLIIVDRDKPKT